MKFSSGDVVVCIQEKVSISGRVLIKEGEICVITATYMDGDKQLVYVEGDALRNISLFATRFKHAEGYETNPILRKIKKMEERFNKRKAPCAA